jgi:hypothetical protein
VGSAKDPTGDGPPREATPRPTPSVRKGTKLGRYLLDDVLGHGAMATVFRARDGQLGRSVAIKVMNLAIAARSDAGERFRREAQAVAALKHPGIVEVHDFAAATDHEPAYIVAELIDGPTLRTLLDDRRGRLWPELAVLVAAQVADALALAHDKGIVHRDIKPDNVMLEKRGKAARVVLTDFGVAHITGLETMTASGALVGSPAYMSPEQGRGQDVGPPADLWGVGVMLYQMVTGTLPFPGKEPFAVMAAVARGTFKRPSQVVAAVSPGLDQLIARCLHPSPLDRYPSARALAEDLRALEREASLGDELPVLRQFLDDPDAFDAALRPRVADTAVERARQHVRRGELGRALNQVGRATAYVPDHRGAAAVLRSISARRRWLKGAAFAGAFAVLVAGAFGGWKLLRRPATKAPLVAAVAPLSNPVAAPRREAPPPALKQSEPPVTVEAPPPLATRRPHARHTPKRDEPPPAPEPTPVVTAPAKDPEPLPPPPVVAPVPKGTVTLYGSKGLCHPSLDERPIPPTPMAQYPDVEPGRHLIYCAANPAGPRLPAGEIVLPVHFKQVTKSIKWNDGKPSF